MAQLGLSPGMVQAVMDGYRARMGVQQQEKARKDAMIQTFLGQLGGGVQQMNANKARQMSMDQAASQAQLDREAQTERDKALFAQQKALNDADNVTSWMKNQADNRRMREMEQSRQTAAANEAAAKTREAEAERARNAAAARGVAGGMGVTIPGDITDPTLARQMAEAILKQREQEQIGSQTAGLMRGFPGVPSVPLPFGPMRGTPAIPAMPPKPDVVARMAGASKSVHPDALKAAMDAAERGFPAPKPMPPAKPPEPGLASDILNAMLGNKQLPDGFDASIFDGMPSSTAIRVIGAIPDKPKMTEPKPADIKSLMSPDDFLAYTSLYNAKARAMGDSMTRPSSPMLAQIDAQIAAIVARNPRLKQAMGGGMQAPSVDPAMRSMFDALPPAEQAKALEAMTPEERAKVGR